jgi:hygromycin-B 7''-O-kinase
MTTTLPGPMSFEDHEHLRADPARWREAAIDIARSHRLPHAELRPFATGSNLVAALDDHLVLKIFPSMLRHQYVAERTTLAVIAGQLAIPTPRIVVDGERDGWPYLVITRLAGIGGEAVWPAMPEDQKLRVLEQIGGVIAAVQAIPPGPLLGLEPRWDEFVPRQIAGCRARHERLGLAPRYLAGLDDYLADAARVVPTAIAPVILTGEYIPENFLLREEAGRWDLAGLIDFGDVMTGWGEYDLLGPSTFMAGGVPARIAALLRGHGTPELDPARAHRLMTLYLLHRFSDLPRQVVIDGWQDRVGTLRELERLIWPA